MTLHAVGMFHLVLSSQAGLGAGPQMARFDYLVVAGNRMAEGLGPVLAAVVGGPKRFPHEVVDQVGEFVHGNCLNPAVVEGVVNQAGD